MFTKWINEFFDGCAERISERALQSMDEKMSNILTTPIFAFYQEYIKFGFISEHTLASTKTALGLNDEAVTHLLERNNLLSKQGGVFIRDVVTLEEHEKLKVKIEITQYDLRIERELNKHLTESIREISENLRPKKQ